MQKTIFGVVDIETTYKKRIAFDIAWLFTDRHGNQEDSEGNKYGSGSYVIRKAFEMDVPFFAEKLGHYFDDAYAHLIKPADIWDVRQEFNEQICALQDKGYRVILCAYNARFDFTYLPKTYLELTEGEGKTFLGQRIPLLDIWNFWGESVPKHYIAPLTNSEKFLSTSAESAYKFEFGKPDFVERHIAFSDCLIEKDILVRALSRKKKLPLVYRVDDFEGSVYKKINLRLGINGKEILHEHRDQWDLFCQHCEQ